jgi:hypothetical protein
LFLDVDYAKDQSGGEQIDARFRIYQGGVVIMESALQTAVGADRVQKTFELSETQIGQLTDLPNLRGAVVANAPSPGTGRRLHLYWARFRSGGKREVVTYTNQTLKAVYDDLIANRLAIPANLRGPGIENTTTTVSKQITGLRKRGPNVKEVVGKTEVEAIAFIADRLIGSSEGKIKAFDVSPSQPVRAIFRSRRITIGEASPGHERRIPEYFVPYRWDATKEEFKDEVRAFHSQSILRIGTVGLGPPQWLEEEIAKWIDSDALAESVGQRVVERLGTGTMLWSFTSVDRYPELEVGDIVAVETDLFVSRDPNINQEIRGRRYAVGPLQRAGSGRFFTIHPRGYADILSDKELASRIKFTSPNVEHMQLNRLTDNTITVAIGTSRALSVRVATSTSGEPSEATTRAAAITALDAAGNVTLSLGTLAPRATMYVAAFAYERGDATGAESLIKRAQITNAPTARQIVLTTGTTWSVPADWNNSSNTIEVIGGGAGGGGGTTNTRGGGGGGAGEYRRAENQSLTPGAVITYAIGGAGAAGTAGGGNGGAGGNTSWNSGAMVANGGGAGLGNGTGGAGGTGGSGGSVNNNGGGGGNGHTATVAGGGGGGGAGGTTAAGSAGANGSAGAGGVGGNGGAASGGQGGNPPANGAVWTSMDGAGGGGNGGGPPTPTAGIDGGQWGGAGGGGGCIVTGQSAGGAGKAGVLVITYTSPAV